MTSKKTTQRQGFKTNEFIVYPSHGVGQIVAIEEQEVAGAKLELFVINFVKDKMTLRVPTAKIASVGMRKLAEAPLVKRALDTLKGRARIKRTMWSRRAQEYEAKINSGDIVAIAEVVRDLYRSETQPEQSYSERQLYEAALDRLSREISAVQRITETEAIKEIEAALAKGPRRGPKPAEGGLVKRALETLKGRARIKRTMWSRRAQEYEAKINSGDIVAIAEVVRDLFRSDTQPEQSYSERQLYEAALDRLSREISAVQRCTETEAIKEIEAALAKGPRRGPKPETEEEAVVEEEAA